MNKNRRSPRKSRSFDRAILDALGTIIAVLDRTGTIIAVNAAWEQFAQTQGDPTLAHTGVGVNYLDVCRRARGRWSEEALQAAAGLEAVLAGDLAEFTLEYPCHSPTEQRWFLLQAAPLRASGGRVVVSHLNITQRKLAEEATARLATIVTSSADAIVSKTLDGIITTWNTSAERLFGYTADEMIGKPILLLLPPERQAEEANILARLRAGERIEQYETVRMTKDGRYLDVSLTISPVRDQSNRVIGAAKIVRDMTERKHLVAQLQDAEVRYRAVFQTSVAGIALVDQDAMFVAANPAYEKIVGYSSDELRTMTGASVVHPNDLPAQMPLFEELVAGKRQSYEIETRLIRKNGEIRWARVCASMIRDNLGEPRYGLAIAVDITEAKRAEEERQQLLRREQEARAEAQEAVRVRETFLLVAAHELRNPLTSLLGNAQLLHRRAARAGTYPERDVRALTTITAQAARMNQLISSLLDMVRLETGHLRIEPAPLNLAALILRVLDEIRPTLARHTLIWQAPDHPSQINGDELRLIQVLQNLIGNAVKYSPQGGTITVRLIHREAQACVAITDEGIGIPADAIPKLFQRFYRADTIETQKIDGIGVGLYVVKEIVRLHGGDIQVESRESEGSTFTVCLPHLHGAGAPDERSGV